MIRIVDKQETDSKTIPMSEMKPLEVGVIVDGHRDGHVVLRTASFDFEVIDITDAGKGICWDHNAKIRVRLLSKGEKITVELFNE